jgi:2-haloalkanoic acid dehalogenase type II
LFRGIRAIVFDVYATLYHNEQSLWQQTFRQIAAEQKLPVDPMDLYTKWRTLERGFRRRRTNLDTLTPVPPFETYEQVWGDCFAKMSTELKLNADVRKATARFIEGQATRALYPDAPPVLRVLKGRFKLAVLSNADAAYLKALLSRDGVYGMMDAVLSSEEAKAYKPASAPFREVLRRLKVQPAEALFIGDTLLDDVRGPRAVGMRATWINRDGAKPEPGDPVPDAVVTTLAELPGLLADGELRVRE